MRGRRTSLNSRNRRLVASLLGAAVLGVAPTCFAAPGREAAPEWFRAEDPRAAAAALGGAAAVDPLAENAPPDRPATAPADPGALPPADAPPGGDRARGGPLPPRYPPPGAFAPPVGYGGGGNYGYAGYGPYDFPAAQLNTYAAALARAATARAMFARAQSELGFIIRDTQRRFETSAEMRQAVVAERDAYNELNAARRRALQAIASDDKYQRLLALRVDLSDRLQQGRADRSATPSEILSMARLKLQYATDARAIEADALNAEPAVKAAQDRLVAAGARIAAMRERCEDQLRHDPDVTYARRNLEDARIAKLTADAFLNGSAVAGDRAPNAFYYGRRPGYRYGYGSDYGYGYGAGYGYPYNVRY